MKKIILILTTFLIANLVNAQVAVDFPCGYTVGSELTPPAPGSSDCGTFTTAGTADNIDATCGSVGVGDAWLWYDGTGAQVVITATSTDDIKIQVLEGIDLDPCSGFFYGQCSDASGAGGTESILGGGTVGARYLILVENAAGTGTVTGNICVVEAAPTCTDGIQNGAEVGVDCGGVCAAPCPPPPITASTSCGATSPMVSNLATCDDVGSAYFTAVTGELNGSTTTDSQNAGAGIPDPGSDPDCPTRVTSGGDDTFAQWIEWNPDDLMTNATLNAAGGDGDGESIYAAFYQMPAGGTCTSDLTLIGCDLLVEAITSMGVTTNYTSPVSIPSLDGTLPVYGYIYSVGMGGSMDFTGLTLIGSETAPTNSTSTFDNCGTPLSVPTVTEGCNLGAVGATFTPPSQTLGDTDGDGVADDGSWGTSTICNGGAWYSNENTVFYSFTPTSSNDTLSIENVTCGNGQTGIAQFGVWGSCAGIFNDPTAATSPDISDFVGCAVGNAPLNLSGLDSTQTYIIAIDGNVGSVCKWDFVGTIITLELTLVDFDARLNDKNTVDLYWDLSNAASEGIVSVILEKGDIDFNYKSLETYKNVNISEKYTYTDNKPFNGINNYRLKLVHNSGKVTYSEVKQIKLNSSFNDISIVPNPVLDVATISFNSNIIGSSELSIIDGRGAEIRKQTIYVVKGQNSISLDTKELSSGIYVAALKGNSGTEVKRFVKK